MPGPAGRRAGYFFFLPTLLRTRRFGFADDRFFLLVRSGLTSADEAWTIFVPAGTTSPAFGRRLRFFFVGEIFSFLLRT